MPRLPSALGLSGACSEAAGLARPLCAQTPLTPLTPYRPPPLEPRTRTPALVAATSLRVGGFGLCALPQSVQ
eukprot:scaffold5664_cov115-Isochrysis_galbana.AAC.27